MYNTIKMEIDGEEMDVIDVKIGDKIGVGFDDGYDEDFSEWIDEYDGDLIVTDVNYDTQTVWLKDCDYGVDMSIITSVTSPVECEIESTKNTILTENDVVKDSHSQIWENEIIVLEADSLNEEYRNRENQLWYAKSGYGLYPFTIGTAVYCTCLNDGETSRWDRYQFLGIFNGELTEKEKAKLKDITTKEV